LSCVDLALSEACPNEGKCHHYLGKGIGPGRVLGTECLIYAVCESQRGLGEKLSIEDFKTKRLQRGDLSLARHEYTNWPTFRDYVVRPRDSRSIKGVAVSTAAEIRGLISPVNGVHPEKSLRAVCILDKVQEGDHAGHAALQYCSEQAALTEKQKKNLRALISADLAETFSTIAAVPYCYPEAAGEGY